jgi:TRAP-type C4-dicarboxylate transport system substrate-binding protein
MERLITAIRPQLAAAFDKRNQVLLFAVPATPVGIWSKVPIEDVEALKRLKIRTYDVNGTVALKNAGSTPVQMAWTDVVPALATGTINGVLTSDEGGIAAKFWEHTQHFTPLNFTTGINYVHVNKDAWNKLSPDVRRIVQDSAKEAEAEAWARSRKRTVDNIEVMKRNGVKVGDAPTALVAHLRNASGDLVKEWKAKVSPQAGAAMDAYLKK